MRHDDDESTKIVNETGRIGILLIFLLLPIDPIMTRMITEVLNTFRIRWRNINLLDVWILHCELINLRENKFAAVLIMFQL